MKMKVICCPM